MVQEPILRLAVRLMFETSPARNRLLGEVLIAVKCWCVAAL